MEHQHDPSSCQGLQALTTSVMNQRQIYSQQQAAIYKEIKEHDKTISDLRVTLAELQSVRESIEQMKELVDITQKDIAIVMRVVSKAEGAKWILGLLVAFAAYIFGDEIKRFFHHVFGG